MSDLKTYLASKYMSGPKADAILQHAGVEKKKRKRPKNEDYVGGSSKGNGGGLVLQDEDEKWRSKKDGIELDGEDAPVIGKEAATFKKGASAWATVGASALPLPAKVKEEPKEDVPAEAGPSEPPKQLTKMKGGLRPAKQIREEAERAAVADKSPSPPPEQDVTQTVHRDQSGRVIDVNDLKAKAIQAEMDEKAKAEERKQWTKGLVQREETERRLQREAAMSRVDVARGADDEAMNRELKQVEHWDDPALQFAGKKKKKGPKFPTYKGAWPENRFNIPPGYRWDGVDRSNGFEKKWIQAQNTYARNVKEADKYSMEDM